MVFSFNSSFGECRAVNAIQLHIFYGYSLTNTIRADLSKYARPRERKLLWKGLDSILLANFQTCVHVKQPQSIPFVSTGALAISGMLSLECGGTAGLCSLLTTAFT